jgi:hypothetical protein
VGWYIEIAGEVEEVIAIGMLGIDFLGEFVDCVFVGDVADHEGGPPLCADEFGEDFELVL